MRTRSVDVEVLCSVFHCLCSLQKVSSSSQNLPEKMLQREILQVLFYSVGTSTEHSELNTSVHETNFVVIFFHEITIICNEPILTLILTLKNYLSHSCKQNSSVSVS